MRAIRSFAAMGVLALVVGACGGTTTSAAPSTAGSAAPESAAASEPASTAQAGQTEIRWFCCLGGGDAPEQVEVEKQVVADFNASHPNIHLVFEAVPYAGANDALATQIASGNGPDIVGPVGIGGANAFHGQWLDLAPLIESTGYDLSGFPPDAVDIYKLDEGQVGIPFAIYPSVLFYIPSLFEEAGLQPPPHEYGAKYTMPDGSQVDWTYDTIREVAKILTVDKNGKDAADPAFDPESIVQWGFEPQRDDLRGLGAYWGAGTLAGADGKTVQIPDAWAAGWKYYYQSIHTDHIDMTDAQFQSKDINPNDYPFFSGDDVAWCWDHYLADRADGESPLASPLRAADLRGLPPALVITAEHDPLRDEAELYAARLREANVPARLVRFDGVMHGFFSLANRLDAAAEAQTLAASALRDVLARTEGTI